MFSEDRVRDFREAQEKKKNVRAEIDRIVILPLPEICTAIQMKAYDLMHEHRTDTRYKAIAEETRKIVEALLHANDEERAKGMLRYLMEGTADSYVVDVKPFMDFLSDIHFTNGPECVLLDLGAGPATLVKEWQKTGRPARGIDLSPSFVLKNPDLRLGLIDDDYAYLTNALDGDFEPNIIVTSMTLDRVRKPKQLLANVVNLARQHGAKFVVSTILPIRPVDDDESAKAPITYTDKDHLLTPGKEVEEDKRIILEALDALADDYIIRVQTLPYTIHSSNVVHNYTQYCFYGEPKA